MARKHHWRYSDAAGHRVADMICTACSKPIAAGQFRFRETQDAYLPQHRACSENDPKWAEMDRAHAKDQNRMRARLDAFKAFRKQWDADELDEAISDMEERLGVDKGPSSEGAPCSECGSTECNGECMGDGQMGD